PRNHSILGVCSSESPFSCLARAFRFAEKSTGNALEMFESVLAVEDGATEATVTVFFVFAPGFAVSPAYNAGTIRKANANVALNRAANRILPPKSFPLCDARFDLPASHRSSWSAFRYQSLSLYGAGTLMTVLTMVTEAFNASARPLSVTTAALPGVENDTPEDAMIVPTIVPPPAALIVAKLPTCQNTFLACAPLTRMILRGAPGAP